MALFLNLSIICGNKAMAYLSIMMIQTLKGTSPIMVSFVLQSIGTFLLAESILAAPLTPRAEAIITRDSKAAPLAPRAEAIITRDSNKYLVGRADADTPSIEIQAGEEGKN
ncbi:hypothetical protein KXV68_005338 [Aspergillus fumigatus]|nr:hypothetical protein KXX63_003756 [Aspergillus fumigatus]KAH2063982.1 hypothetical protein KXX03_002278 [Aspergillus fumigatus]KAH2129686.1 hypothetical protein KXV35_002117 [Aspergillus fumigatus]KAH2144458.1 hypothetical protein KXV68_005338 [Aspergillus fumigatus]KAH2495370.1 hypothetical protein KXW70_003640 [Aspergillus fumigatus]